MRKADNLPPSCAVVIKSGNLNFLEPSGPVQACNGTALPLPLPVPFTVVALVFSLGLLGFVSYIINVCHQILFLLTAGVNKLFYHYYVPDCLCGLVVRVSGYRYRGPGFDPRRYQIF